VQPADHQCLGDAHVVGYPGNRPTETIGAADDSELFARQACQRVKHRCRLIRRAVNAGLAAFPNDGTHHGFHNSFLGGGSRRGDL
jgi:hypothetical protein